MSQRAELERLAGEVAAGTDGDGQAVADEALQAVSGELESLRVEVRDFRKLQKTGAEGVIESLEGMRERVGKLEARVAEMSREARAKGGRLDALARHVSGVENRLTSALGSGGKPVVAVASEIDKSLQATG